MKSFSVLYHLLKTSRSVQDEAESLNKTNEKTVCLIRRLRERTTPDLYLLPFLSHWQESRPEPVHHRDSLNEIIPSEKL